MHNLDKIAQALQDIELEAIVTKCLLAKKGGLIEENKANLQAGVDSNREVIAPPYTPYTRKIKANKGQPFDRVTLKDTGDFYSGINIKQEASAFTFYSSDDKEQKLFEKYGKDILGVPLDSETLEEVRGDIIAKIKERIIQ